MLILSLCHAEWTNPSPPGSVRCASLRHDEGGDILGVGLRQSEIHLGMGTAKIHHQCVPIVGELSRNRRERRGFGDHPFAVRTHHMTGDSNPVGLAAGRPERRRPEPPRSVPNSTKIPLTPSSSSPSLLLILIDASPPRQHTRNQVVCLTFRKETDRPLKRAAFVRN